MNRLSSGILMHISSLPSKYGIGTFGVEARRFIDFLVETKQSYWQILPLGPTSYGDSPYQSFSTYAGNPYFIDLDYLRRDGLLKLSDYKNIKWSHVDEKVEYETLYENRFKVLKIAVDNFKDDDEYIEFIRTNTWLEDYSLYMTIKNKFNDCAWLSWPKRYRSKDEETLNNFKKEHGEQIRFHMVIQYFFFKQWFDLKKYANDKGIEIFGDCPIYVALDSADVWANRQIFKLKKNGTPKEVAGVPPDYFSAEGQLWGNPLYNWRELKKNNYHWWLDRICHLSKMYDILRIDHFIGFESYYAIKYGSVNAVKGRRYRGPGMKIIKKIAELLPDSQIVAEDLGVVTAKVRKLLKATGYPGMRMMCFGFNNNDDNDNLVKNIPENCVAYITSHDTETLKAWYDGAPNDEKAQIDWVCKIKDEKNANWNIIDTLQKSKAYITIIQVQDLLALGIDSRMNTPGTLGGNWIWRIKPKALNKNLINKLKRLTISNKRANNL